jgi:hypothetical protein
MNKFKKNTRKIKVTEEDFIDFSKIASIPKDCKKSMVLYLTTWQEEPHNPEDTDTMITKPA